MIIKAGVHSAVCGVGSSITVCAQLTGPSGMTVKRPSRQWTDVIRSTYRVNSVRVALTERTRHRGIFLPLLLRHDAEIGNVIQSMWQPCSNATNGRTTDGTRHSSNSSTVWSCPPWIITILLCLWPYVTFFPISFSSVDSIGQQQRAELKACSQVWTNKRWK